jgi:3-dehydroquinate dehydratase type I
VNSQHVLPIQPESFVYLVKLIKEHYDEADVFEVWLDKMRVKGDLAVIQKHFDKPIIGKSEKLDMLKRAAKAGLTYVDVPHDLKTDLEFKTLAKNKETKVIRSYHNFEMTPPYDVLTDVLDKMKEDGADFLKIATHINNDEDEEKLFSLLKEPHFHGRLIITGMGDKSRNLRIKAPIKGSVFYYAPVNVTLATAPGQLSRAELEQEWKMI